MLRMGKQFFEIEAGAEESLRGAAPGAYNDLPRHGIEHAHARYEAAVLTSFRGGSYESRPAKTLDNHR
jgi:hypothetical protein